MIPDVDVDYITHESNHLKKTYSLFRGKFNFYTRYNIL